MAHGINLDFSWNPTFVWDAPETITYHAPDNHSDAQQSVELNTAIRTQLTFKEVVASGGYYVSQDCHWFLAGAGFEGTLRPKVGGRIVQAENDGDEWTVLDLSFEDLDQVWDCVCRNFVLVEGLTSTINILTPHTTQDTAAGRVVVAWVPKYQGIPARIHELSSETVNERGRRVQQKTFQVFVGRRVDVTHEDLIEDVLTGKRYEFVSSDSPANITSLQTLTMRRTLDQLP